MNTPKGLSVIEHDNKLLAKLYNTLIVEFNRDNNRLKLRTGGWYTRHTKKCINLVLNKHGLYVTQEQFKWKLYQNGTLLGAFDDNGLLEVSVC